MSSNLKELGDEIMSGRIHFYKLAIPSKITKEFREYTSTCSRKGCKEKKTRMVTVVPGEGSFIEKDGRIRRATDASQGEEYPFFLCPNCESRKKFSAPVRAAFYSDRYLGLPFYPGTKGRRLYIKKVPLGRPSTDAILVYRDVTEKNLEGYEIDWEKMWRVSVLEKVSDFLTILGIDEKAIYPIGVSHEQGRGKEGSRKVGRAKKEGSVGRSKKPSPKKPDEVSQPRAKEASLLSYV